MFAVLLGVIRLLAEPTGNRIDVMLEMLFRIVA